MNLGLNLVNINLILYYNKKEIKKELILGFSIITTETFIQDNGTIIYLMEMEFIFSAAERGLKVISLTA